MISTVRNMEAAIRRGNIARHVLDDDYYFQNKEVIDRYSTIKGKTSYDIPQLEIIGDILSGAKATAQSLFYDYLAGSMHHEWLKNKDMINVEQPLEYIKKAEESHIEYKQLADDLREGYRKKIEAEPGTIQRFSASMAAESLRVFTDVRQLPALIGTSLLSPAIAGYIGATSVAGKVGTAMVLNGFENLIEDNVDTYFTDDRFQSMEENIYSFGGGAGGALFFSGLGAGVKAVGKKLDQLSNQKISKTIANDMLTKAAEKIDKNAVINKGDTTAVDYKNITETVENLKEINEHRGTVGSEQDVVNKHLYINGVNRADGLNKAGLIIQKLIDDPEIDFIKNGADFNEHLSKNPESIYSLVKAIKERGGLTEEEDEAFGYFLDVIGKEKVTDLRFDTEGAVNEINENISNLKNGYEPMFEEQKIQTYRVDEESFNNNRRKTKHNYKDYSKDGLIQQLERDGIIPEGAKIKFVRGNIPKTPVNVKSNLDADGNLVYVRKQWLKGDPVMEFEYELNGKKYYGELTLTKEHGYLGNVYELDSTATKGTKENITPKKLVTNIVDDMNGTPEPIKPVSNQELRDIILKELGIDKKYNSKIGIKDSILKLQKKVGEIVKKNYDVNSVEEMVERYKFVYNMEFEYKGKKTMDSIGETRVINKDGRKVIEIYISDKIDDLDTELGIMRHEIQHVIDLHRNPDFKSKAFSQIDGAEDMTIDQVLNKVGSGHFSGFDDMFFETSYIIRNQMDKLVENGKINDEVVEILKLTMPEEPTTADIKVVEKIIKNSKAEDDPAKALARLRKELSTYTKMKKDFSDLFFNAKNTAEATASAAEWLETNIFIPFEKVDQQMRGLILSALEVKDSNGNILSPEKLLDLFNTEKVDGKKVGSLSHYLFRWDSELPEELKYLEPQLLKAKQQLYSIMKDIVKGSDITVEDMVNNFLFDQSLSIERYMQAEELVKFLDENKNIDMDRLMRGDLTPDEVTGVTIPQRLKNIRDRFAEENAEFFRSAPEVAEEKFKKRLKKMKKKDIIKELENIKNCMSKEEKIAFIKKYKLDEIPAIQKYLEKNNFFEDIEPNKIAENILESRKRNAKFMYTMDLMSKRGNLKNNKLLGTHLARFGRFERWLKDDMLISRESLRKLVDKNRTSDRVAMLKFMNTISAAKAMQEVLPDGAFNNVLKILNNLQEYGGNADFQTFSRDVVGRIDERIGLKLGRETKPPKGKLDKFVSSFFGFSNKVSLLGPKAAKDFVFEIPTIDRAVKMLYGRSGTIDIMKNFMKAAQILHMNKQMYDKVDKAMGKRFENSVPIQFIGAVLDDTDDYFGVKAERMLKYGSKAEKIISSIDKNMNKLNFYGQTQRIMKLGSLFIASETLRDLGKYADIEDLFSKNTSYIKRVFQNIGIDDLDFYFIKRLDEIDAFKEDSIFSEIDVFDFINKSDMEEKIGRTLSEEEFSLTRKNVTDKITKLYDKIATDISPTEANPSLRASIENIRNPIHRNFMRAMVNFKTSINEQWRRFARDYYLSNMNDGKFDWRNKIWWKRFSKHVLTLPIFYGGVSLLTDPETYSDPIASIEEKVDNLFDDPGSKIWELIDSQINTWALVNGAAVARRPITISQNLLKGDVDKAFENMMKLAMGTSNFNLTAGTYKKLQEIEDEF